MALSNYTELQASVLDWMVRAGQTGQVVDWIALAEARLNRELGPVETDTTLTGVVDSRRIDISAVPIVQPIALFLAEVGSDEVRINPAADGTFPYLTTSGRPTKWAIDGTNIDFDRPLDSAYPFRFRYRQRFALATSSTNWLLTNHPDVYLAASIVWGSAYNKNLSEASAWKQLLDEAIPSIKSSIAQSKRAVLTVDPGLASRGGALSQTEWTNG
jgi:hypothetical protein